MSTLSLSTFTSPSLVSEPTFFLYFAIHCKTNPCSNSSLSFFTSLSFSLFSVAGEMEYTVSDEYYRRHFLAGVLLREVESALQYEAGGARKRTIRILRDLLAKHDCDSRYNKDTVRTLDTVI